MSRWEYLSTSLSEQSGVFGEFNQCLSYQSGVQDVGRISSQSLPRTKTLQTVPDVRFYTDGVATVRPSLCILAFTSPSPEKNGKLPLPISKTLFQHIVEAFDISSEYLPTLSTGLATYHTTVLPQDKESCKKESAQFVIQQNRAYSACSIALTVNVKTGQTRVLLFGAETWFLSQLFEYLDSMAHLPHGPMVVPTIAMELQCQWFSKTINSCHEGVRSIENATGMRQFNHPYEYGHANTQDWKNLDLISITRDLSGFLSRFAFIKLQAETGEYLLEQMARSTEAIVRNSNANEELHSDQCDVLSKIEQIQSLYKGMAARCRYLTERATAQSQTVYCLIASKDNLTNMDIAEASRRIAEDSCKENEAMRTIAEIGRRDNQLMIQVAKDSRNVAIATARDSAAMQVIAAVTVLFLPATFIATFFSMTFFDFSDDRPRVSSWTWLYFLVTAVLTIVIQAAWAVLSKRKSEKITQGITVELENQGNNG